MNTLRLWAVILMAAYATVARAETSRRECFDSVSGQTIYLNVMAAHGELRLFTLEYRGVPYLTPNVTDEGVSRLQFRVSGILGALVELEPGVLRGERGELEFIQVGNNATYTCN